MLKKTFLNRFWLVMLLSLAMAMPATEAFGRDGRTGGRGGSHGSRHEYYRHGGRRYHYYDGRWYLPGLFWFGLNFVIPPIGATVTYLPARHRTIIIGGITYYEYDNVYYRTYPGGYTVVPAPVANPTVIYEPAVTQSQTGNRETVTVNVPTSTGGTIAITLVRYPNGFVGPQGEFYPTLPTAEQLRARYAR